MIILLFGNEPYLIERHLVEMRDKFIHEHDPSNLNYDCLEGSALVPAELARAVLASPFLAKRRMVVVKQLLSKKMPSDYEKAFVDIIKRLSLETILVFVEGETKLWKNRELAQALNQTKFKYEHNTPKGAGLLTWIKNEAKKKNISLNQKVLSKLAVNFSLGLGFIAKEIEKLAAAAAQQRDGEESLVVLAEGSIYQFVDCLLERDARRAFDQFDASAVPLLAKQIGLLLQIKDWQNKKRELGGLKEVLGVHPFVLQKSLILAKRFSYDHLRQIHRELLLLDAKIKRGAGHPDVLVSHFVAQVILSPR